MQLSDLSDPSSLSCQMKANNSPSRVTGKITELMHDRQNSAWSLVCVGVGGGCGH